MNKEARTALLLAADALELSTDWGVTDVQIEPPPEWGLVAVHENPDDGWCSVMALARLLRDLAK